MSNLYRGPSIDASYLVAIQLAVAAMFANESERNAQSLQRTFHRCFLPSFGCLVKRFQRRRFFQKSTNQKQELSVAAMFVNGSQRNEQSLQKTFQVSVHLAKQFQRRRFLNLNNQKQELPVAAMFVNGSGQNVQSLERTFHRCFLPSFSSFGCGVSEKKIKM